MTDKAYIVVNGQQEREVLGILGTNGLKYVIGTYSQFRPLTGFPYVIYESDTSNVLKSGRVPKIKYSTEIVFDGRKEEQMSDKYVVSPEFMYGLEEWRKNKNLINELVWYTDIKSIPEVVKEWWAEDFVDKTKTNNRLIAIIHWVNGEDVFEVKKTKKWVVRSKERDSDGDYWYVDSTNNLTYIVFYENDATKFDTKEEAESWANSHQEVVEVEA